MNWPTPWWPDAAALLQMGQHGTYVWPAFGACALALAWEWWGLARQARRLRGLTVDAERPLTPALSPEGRGSNSREQDLPPLPLGAGRGEGHPRWTH